MSKFKKVFSTPFFEIEENRSSGIPDSRPYYRLTGKDSSICCVMGDKGHFVMVRQFRPNLGINTLEFPAGGVEANESPFDAAHREIAEETGLRCRLLELGIFNLMMNRTNIRDHLFFGMDPEHLPDYVTEKGVEMVEVPRQELVSLALNGGYMQLAGLGILQLVSITLGVDVLRDPVELIYEQFRTSLSKQEHAHKAS